MSGCGWDRTMEKSCGACDRTWRVVFRGNHLWGDDSRVEKLDVDIRRFTVKFFSRDGVAVSYGCEYSCIW